MNPAFPDHQPERDPSPEETLFGVAIDQLDPELYAPLSALRHKLHELGELLDEDPERAALFGQAMENLDEVDRYAQHLAAYAGQSPRPSTCTIEDLANRAVGDLPDALRDSVWLTPDDQTARIATDPELMAASLTCLLEEVLRGSDGEVLLHAHSAADVAYFSIVESKPREGVDLPASAALMARRDLERLGAEVSVRLHDPNHPCVTVRMPLAVEPGL